MEPALGLLVCSSAAADLSLFWWNLRGWCIWSACIIHAHNMFASALFSIASHLSCRTYVLWTYLDTVRIPRVRSQITRSGKFPARAPRSALGPSGVWFLESHVRPPVNCNKQAGHLISGLIFVLQRRPYRRGLDKGEDKVEPHWKVTVAAKQCNPSTHSFQRMPNSSLKMSCGPRLH